MPLRDAQHGIGTRLSRRGVLAIVLMIAGCKGASVSGAAGNQVGRTGAPRSGMERDNNGGGGY